MKTTNYFKQYIGMSVVSLFLFIACLFIWFNKPLDSIVKTKPSVPNGTKIEENRQDLADLKKEEKVINEFITILFEYEDRSNSKRFDKLSDIATGQVIQQAKDLFPKLEQEVQIKSNVSSLEFYHGERIEGELDHRVIVNVSMNYQVESNTMALSQLVEVSVQEERIGEKETYVVTDFTAISSQTNTSEGAN